MKFKLSLAKKAVSTALLSSAVAMSVSSGALADDSSVTPFVPGQTKIENGDMTSYAGECYIAQNNPGVWETPSPQATWFWAETDCPDDTDPEEPDPDPDPEEPGDVIPFIPGQTKVENGEMVSYKGECFIAKNSPGAWETPSANSWFWDASECPSNPPVDDPDGPSTGLPPQIDPPPVDDPSTGPQPQIDPLPPVVVDPGKPGTPITDPDDPDYPGRPNNPGEPDVPLEPGTPPTDPEVPRDLCDEFNVYPDWTNETHAGTGDIMVHDNIAHSAKYWTTSVPGSDDSWQHHLNCDGTDPGTAPLLSLPNPMDPVDLQVNGWPSDFVAAGPSSDAPDMATLEALNSEELSDDRKLTTAFVELIETAENAGSSSVIISSNVLDNITEDKGASLGTIAVIKALTEAVDFTGSRIDIDDINALSDDAQGWVQAHNLVMSTLAPKATFGWSLSIGNFAYGTHSGKRSVWEAASKATADLLGSFDLYEGKTKADFIAFSKSSDSAALSSGQWHNALEYVKQVTDYVEAPAMLSSVPTEQAAAYFMGNTAGESNIRKAAHSNIFAILFDTDTVDLTDKIKRYQSAKVPLYYVGENVHDGPLTVIESLNRELADAEEIMNNDAFLFETPTSGWIPSTVYKWADFLTGLNSMHNIGVAGDTFWLIDESADDQTNAKYAKVAIAAFLAQSMQETIRYNACDENNWAEVKYGAPTDYPMTASCGQLDQKYADYGFNPETGRDHPYSCPRDEKMEVSALTHAQWYGAPAPIFAAPDAVLDEQGLLVNGHVGRWTNNGHCNDVPTAVDTSKQVYERNECQVYEGQKAGSFIWDGSSQDSVQGCGWWGRGVIQTTGRQNFGTLNHFMGRSHVDPDTIGKTIDGITVGAPPESPLYAQLDFCSNPGLICSSEENREIKWIAGLFFWVNSVQAYDNESGQHPGWDYYEELKKYVDGGMKGSQFIDDVSGIVNRGCPDLTCDTGDVHNVKERRDNFMKVLRNLGLNPQ
ncbi:cellulose-binding domain-containing protein [Psychromonas ossibalaenae]|uniref:cellulose-binding domain-containing protein n=1 Tax=Psychromonas ossibalaenae TaxID=444922 RepID=UPI0003763ED9|nr:cellulose-binding domain-containing protein [Psychromonas ossibalaenae]